MAITSTYDAFNPDVKDEKAQTYLGLSEAAKPPQPDTSAGQFLKNFGELSTDAIKVAHFLTQERIGDEEYAKLTQKREAYKTGLDQVYAQLNTMQTGGQASAVSAAATGTPTNLATNPQAVSANPAPTPPEDVEKGIQRVALIEATRQGGKYSQTHLDAQYDSVLKDLRARFPGFTDYIDERAKQITGRDPANDYIKSRIADINSLITNANTANNHLMNLMSKEDVVGVPGMRENALAFKNGLKSYDEAFTFYARSVELRSQAAQSAARLKQVKDDKELYEIHAVAAADQMAQPHIVNPLENLFATYGIERDPKKFQQWVNNADDTTLGQVVTTIKSAGLKAEMDIQNEWRATKVPGSTMSYYDFLESKETGLAAKKAKAQTSIYGDVSTLLKSRNADLATIVGDANKAIIERGTNWVYGHVPGFLAASMVSHSMPHAVQDIAKILVESGISKQWNPTVAEEMSRVALGRATNPLTNAPKTISDTIDENIRAGKNDPTFNAPKTTDAFLHLGTIFTNPQTDKTTKTKFADYFFSTEGQSWMNKIEGEGKYGVYNRFSSPEVVDTMKSLGGKYWQNYKDWHQTTFGAVMLRSDLLSLKDVAVDPGLTLGWNDTSHQYEVRNKQGINMLEPGFLTHRYGLNPDTKRLLVNINSTIANYSAVAEADGKKPEAYILEQFNKLSGMQGTNLTGFPAQMRDAIANTEATSAKQREQQKKDLERTYPKKNRQ